jgi:hypothetical protein
MSGLLRRTNPLAMLYAKMEDPGGSGSGELSEEEEEGGTETETATEEQDLGTVTEAQSPFSNSSLAGRFKTEQDLLEFLSVQDSALKATRTRASQLEMQLTKPASAVVEEEEEGDAQQFFREPHKEVARIVERQLKGIVSPLLQDMETRRSRGEWDLVKEKYSNFGTYQEAVEETLKSWNVPSNQQSAELIERVFLSEVGKASIEGNFVAPNGRAMEEAAPTGNRINPQHRPSSHPTSSDKGDGRAKIKLTEEERKLARIQFKNKTDKDGKPIDPEQAYIDWALDENKDGHYLLDEN